MDTHDTPLLHRGLPLRPGMVITMEPGLYVSENDLNVPEKYEQFNFFFMKCEAFLCGTNF